MEDTAETTADELEGWVREELSLDPSADAYSFHIERPLVELERMDLIAALAFGGGH